MAGEKSDPAVRPLVERACVPCRAGAPVLKGHELKRFLDMLGGGWRVVDEHHLSKEFRFKDFREALRFTNRIGELAEELGHHPDLRLSWGRVRVVLYTHKIDGLHENDFILAARIEALASSPG
jgi:4a-hydroxytetrahydrobiopterin dehydratase